MDEDEEPPTCPLCLEELDATDRAVRACQCGYQVCLLCLHQIRECHNGKCPACRTPYKEEHFRISGVDHEAAAKEAKERATAKKERERRERHDALQRERERAALVSQQKAKSNVRHVRIVQRNLVYIIGLSLSLAREEVLRRTEMFGKFGRITRVLVNRAHLYNADMPGGPSISAYVLYTRDADATSAVRQMNLTVIDGREIRCSIACTKYCDVFIRAAVTEAGVVQHCGNAACLYVHEIAHSDDVLTREEVLTRQLGPPPPAHLFGGVGSGPVLPPRKPFVKQQPPLHPTRARPSQPQATEADGRPLPAASTAAAQPVRRLKTSTSRSSSPSSPDCLRRVPQTAQSPLKNASSVIEPSSPRPHPGEAQRQNACGWKSSPLSPYAADEASKSKRSATQQPYPPQAPHAPPPERSPPPGFERVLPKEDQARRTPRRPPGFEDPLNSQSHPPPQEALFLSNPPQRPVADFPPGFSMGSEDANSNSDRAQPSISHTLHPSMVWLREASQDQVLSTEHMQRDRSTLTPIGAPMYTSPPNSSQKPYSNRANPEFVDVLGRIGGNLGVSSHVTLNPTGPGHASLSTGANHVHAPRSVPTAGSSAHGSRARGGQFHDVRSESAAINESVNYPNYGGGALFARPQTGNSVEVKQSKRSNSRFGFARDNADVLHSTLSPNSCFSSEYGVHLLRDGPMHPSVPARNLHRSTHVGHVPAQQSRFGFADRSRSLHADPMSGPVNIPHSKPNAAPIRYGGEAEAIPPISSSAEMDRLKQRDYVSSNLADKFAQMTTADKLASLFNQAQVAPEMLPPMPQLNANAAITDEVALLSERNHVLQPRPPRAMDDAPPNSPPPGFRRATSERPPDRAVSHDAERSDVAVQTEKHGGDVPKRSKSQKKRDRRRGRALKSDQSQDAQKFIVRAHSHAHLSNESKPAVEVRAASPNATDDVDAAPALMTVHELEREVQAARERKQMLQSRLIDLQRRIARYGRLVN